ncbi:unnamed protein product, partial [Symbiodinium pilosum]
QLCQGVCRNPDLFASFCFCRRSHDFHTSQGRTVLRGDSLCGATGAQLDEPHSDPGWRLFTVDHEARCPAGALPAAPVCPRLRDHWTYLFSDAAPSANTAASAGGGGCRVFWAALPRLGSIRPGRLL